MQSTMETATGLTYVAFGTSVRIPRSSPVYGAVKLCLAQDIPIAEKLKTIRQYLAESSSALKTWAEGFGFKLEIADNAVRLGDFEFSRGTSEKFFERLMRSLNSPDIAAKLHHVGLAADLDSACFWYNPTEKVTPFRRVVQANVVRGSSLGQLTYIDKTPGGVEALVALEGAGAGEMVRPLSFDVPTFADVLTQPVILGYNQTYRCEIVDDGSWFHDDAFDSLTAAITHLNYLRREGEARIVNRVSGKVLHH